MSLRGGTCTRADVLAGLTPQRNFTPANSVHRLVTVNAGKFQHRLSEWSVLTQGTGLAAK